MVAAARRGIAYFAFTPYWERAFLRSDTPAASRVPRITLYRTPGRSLTRPPRTSTTECSCRLWPSPGMYAVTSIWLVSRTRQTLRRAEFGFFGVVVYTRVQTPRRWGAATFVLRPLPDFRPGVASFFFGAWRPLRTSWEVVGIRRGMLAARLADDPGPRVVATPPAREPPDRARGPRPTRRCAAAPRAATSWRARAGARQPAPDRGTSAGPRRAAPARARRRARAGPAGRAPSSAARCP